MPLVRAEEESDTDLTLYYVGGDESNGHGHQRHASYGRGRPASRQGTPGLGRSSKLFTTPKKRTTTDDLEQPEVWVEKVALPLGEGGGRSKNKDMGSNKLSRGVTVEEVAGYTWPVHGKIKLGSPRSIEACLQHGVDPAMLVHKPLEAFLDFEEDPELREIQFQHYEMLRTDLLAKVMKTRESLPPDGKWAQGKLRKEDSSNLPTAAKVLVESSAVDQEKERLKKRKEKQAAELQQIESYENKRAEMQAELDAKMRRVAAKEAARKEAQRKKEEERQRRIFHASLKKVDDEKRTLEESRRKAQEAWMAEQEERKAQMERELEQMRIRQEETRERAQRALEWRQHNQAILEHQSEVLERKRRQMEEEEERRQQTILEMRIQRQQELLERNRRVEQRMVKTRKEGQNIMAARRDEFDQRDQRAAQRRKEQMEARARKERQQRKAEEEKEARRREAKAKAEEQERQRVEAWRRRHQEEEERQAEIQRERELELRKKVLGKQMKAEEKAIRVKCNARRRAFENKKLLEKIQEDTMKADLVRNWKEELRMQRRQANIDNSMFRQAMLQDLEQKQLELARKNNMKLARRPETSHGRYQTTPQKSGGSEDW